MLTQAKYNQVKRKMWKDYWQYKDLGVNPIPKSKIIRTLRKLEKKVRH